MCSSVMLPPCLVDERLSRASHGSRLDPKLRLVVLEDDGTAVPNCTRSLRAFRGRAEVPPIPVAGLAQGKGPHHDEHHSVVKNTSQKCRVARLGTSAAGQDGLCEHVQAPDDSGAQASLQALLTGPGGLSSKMTALAASSCASSCSFSAMASAAPACTRRGLTTISPNGHNHSCGLEATACFIVTCCPSAVPVHHTHADRCSCTMTQTDSLLSCEGAGCPALRCKEHQQWLMWSVRSQI